MTSQDVQIINRLGLHARAAAQLVRVATQFQASVTLKKGPQQANAKTIMEVLMLAATKGTTIAVETHGSDEEAALAAVLELINNRFNEAE
jgi:phosphocarrier protein